MEISSSTAHHHQKLMAASASLSSSSEAPAPAPAVERKPRPQADKAVDCPRCRSTNTKFCYYNNYSMAQPRYFCKACRRYWTQGGSLRNVPVGGGCRKNRRSASKTGKPAVAMAAPPLPPPCTDLLPTLISTCAGLELPPMSMSMAFPSGCSAAVAAIAPAGGASFLDILRGAGGFLDGSDGMQLQYGGGGIAMPPLPLPSAFGQSLTTMLHQHQHQHQHGLGDSAASAATQGLDAGEEGGGAMVGLRWPPQLQEEEGSNSNANVNVNVDVDVTAMDKDGVSSRDCYWSNGAGNPWQGLINSSSQLI